MKVFKYHPPYKQLPANGKPGRTSFPETKGKSGVYLIKENGKLVYVGFSGGQLYHTLYHHFSEWTDKSYSGHRSAPPAHRVSYKNRLKRNDYPVRVILCSPAQAERLERALIIKYQPRDNDIKYESYQLDLRDKTLVTEYLDGPVSRECPF